MTTQGHHEATRPYQLGIDVGSTTVKAVVLDGNRRLFSDYRRHNADVRASLGPSSPTLSAPCPVLASTRPSPAPAA